jgi:hypothetical protein
MGRVKSDFAGSKCHRVFYDLAKTHLFLSTAGDMENIELLIEELAVNKIGFAFSNCQVMNAIKIQ